MMDRKLLEPYLDKWGLICKRGDGGDSAANEFTVLYCEAALGKDVAGEVGRVHRALTHESGVPIRHLDPRMWYSEADRYSRDQLYPRIFALGITKNKRDLKQLFWQHLKRGLCFAWNTRANGVGEKPWKVPDFTGPEVWAAWIRAFRLWPLYPLLFILDLENLISNVVKQIQFHYFTPDFDQRNAILSTDFGCRVMPTPVSLLSRWVYGTTLPKMAALHWWFVRKNEPPIHRWVMLLVDSWSKK